MRLLFFSFIFFFLIHCAIGPVSGGLFTYTRFAGETNPSNDIPSTKTVVGCQHSFLLLFSFGDASAGQIAYEKGIKRIATIDHSTFNILHIVYNRYCTIVQGSTY